MPVLSRLSATALISGILLVSGGAAWAGLGQPTPWQMDLQGSASPVMEDVANFHFFRLWVIAVISAFVLALLLICIVRFNARANPTPSRTTHNTPIEILWTIVPVIILAAIAEATPTREALLRDANQRGERPPPLNVARLTAIAPGACRLH